MTAIRRRLLGLVLLVAATFSFLPATVLWPAPQEATMPGFADAGSLVGLALPALVAAGSILLVAGVVAVGGADLSARTGLVVPVVGAVAALGLAAAAGIDPITAFDPSGLTRDVAALTLPDPYLLALTGAVVGGAVAPVTLGSTTGDTVGLLAGALLLLVGSAAAPSPGLALLTGLGGGVVAIGVLWVVDPATWRP